MRIATLNIHLRPTFLATFNTIFGIGLLKAKRLESFLLVKPFTKGTLEPYNLLRARVGYKILYRMPVERRLKLFILKYLERQYKTYHYKTFRILQGLPASGQRTRSNAGTPRRFNHYAHLNMPRSGITAMIPKYKKLELFFNQRFHEYKTYADALINDKQAKKLAKKQRAKIAREQYYKSQKHKSKTKHK